MKSINNLLNYLQDIFPLHPGLKRFKRIVQRKYYKVPTGFTFYSLNSLLIFLLICGLILSNCSRKSEAPRPNIIIILADDMGYSDIGFFGSEINTPNIDALAREGLVMTQFYNAGRCCPTRASLLTGLYQHQAGVGHMNDKKGYPSYQGFLNDSCVTIAEVLHSAGYHTLITGKWHVGDQQESWPLQRGFDRFYGFPKGGGVYFYPWRTGRDLVLNNDIIDADSSFYSTDAFTDYAIKFVNEVKDSPSPFFLYLPYISPHFPLQAHQEDLLKYRGKYASSWKVFRDARYNRMLEAGIFPGNVNLSPENDDVFSWEDLPDVKKNEYDLRMAVYAAQVECMDRNIGRLIEKLREWDKLDKTVIFFLSDNGGSNEPLTNEDNSEHVLIGSRNSWASYHAPWANVSNTPFRLYKHWVHEGGISTPLVIHYPEMIKEHKIDNQLAHIIDLMPTCLDLAGASYPETYNEKNIQPVEGKSMIRILKSEKRIPHDYLFWEHMGNKAIRWQKWKLVMQYEKQTWELYDMTADRSEINDLSLQYPELIDKLSKVYEEWEEKVGVVPWDSIR